MKRGKVLLALLLLLLPASAYGAVDIFAGAEADTEDQSFSYIGVGAGWPMEDNYSLVAKITAAFLEYKFKDDSRTLKADVSIATPAVGIRVKESNYTLEGFVGLDLRETEKDRPQGGTDEDTEGGLALEGQVSVTGAGDVIVGLLGNYSTVDDFYWLRARVKKGVHEFDDLRLYVGGEAGAMGNDDFDSLQVGGLAEFYYPEVELSLLLKAGFRDSSAAEGAYVGVEFYYSF